MVLCAPNSIALSTNEDLHLSADKQINHSAADSISFSTQKSLIAHAQDRISLFAAKGFRAIAAKAKLSFKHKMMQLKLLLANKSKLFRLKIRLKL